MKAEVAADIRAGFNAANRQEAERLPGQLVARDQERATRLATWMEEKTAEGLRVFAFPAARQRRLRTSDGLERVLHKRICVINLLA